MNPTTLRLRFSLKALIALTTLTGILVFYFNQYRYYHSAPLEVQLGSYKVISGAPDSQHQCNCEIYLNTNYHDILTQRIKLNQKNIQKLIVSVFRSVPFEEKCDPRLASLRNQIKDCVRHEVGKFQGHQLVNEVYFSKYSVMQKPIEKFQ